MTSSMRSFSIRSVSIAMTRSRFFSATAISRVRFSCWMPNCSSVRMFAVSARSRSSARTRVISASSRARTVSISRRCLASASAWRRSSSRIASRASTFCRVISFSSLRWNSLVRTCSIAVSSVIFRMPWASRMFFASSWDIGVCSRKSIAASSRLYPLRSVPITRMIWSRNSSRLVYRSTKSSCLPTVFSASENLALNSS